MPKQNKKYFRSAIICFLISPIHLIAQSYTITGQVLLSNDSIAPLTSVSLYNNQSKTLIASTITNPNGYFEIKGIKRGCYNLISSMIGYVNDTLVIDNLSRDLNVGNIYLKKNDITLKDVVVTSKNIINKDGIKYITPSAYMLKNTTDALMMLDKANLPRLNIDVNNKSIQINGGGVVKLYLNGRESNIQETSSLHPSDILRIEYHDIPEARYNYADIVLNIITKKIISGESLYVSLWQGALTSFGEDNIAARINHKSSQFSLSYYLAYRNWSHLSRQNDETFHLNDTTTIYRTEKGIPSAFKYDNHYTNFSYNYQKNNRIFYASLKANIEHQPHYDWNSLLYSSDTPIPNAMTDSSGTKRTLSSLNIYYQEPIGKKELLIFNVSGSYANNKYNRSYQEINNNINLTNLKSSVTEKQNAFLLSSLYENKLKRIGTLDIGIDYRQKYTEDNYSNIYNFINNIDTSTLNLQELKLYSQLRFTIKKVTSSIGLSANETWTKTNVTQYNYFTFQPSLSVKYSPSNNWELSYYGSVSSTPPTLSALSDAIQRIDSIQLQQGNPTLKRQINYYNAIVISGDTKKNKFGGSIYLNQTYVRLPIMEATYFQDNQVIRTTENQKNFQRYNAELEFRAKPLKGFILMKVYTGIKYFISHGNNYNHNVNTMYYGGRITFNYKKVSLSWSLQQNTSNDFWGETFTKYEDGHMLSLSYNTEKYSFSVDGLNLFTKPYINAKENYSAIASYTRYEYLDEIKNLIRINFKCNLSFGKQYSTNQRKLQGNDDIESGILKGIK